MNKPNKVCQSCGMPLKRDEKGGGTNADGSRNALYCSHCYAQGQFVSPNMTVGQMQDLVKQKMREMGFPGLIAGMFTKRIPKLERWNSSTRAS